MNHITSLAAAKAALQSAWASVSRQFPLVLLTLLLVALALPAGMVVAPAFTGQGLHPQQPAPSVPPWQQSPRDLSLPKAAPLTDVAPLSDSAPVPLPEALSARLNATLTPDGAGTFSGLVQDAVTGQVLFDRAGADARVPASNLKLLTATAALRSLGPDHRFSTKVLAGPTAGSVVLSAGGDVLLTAGESSDDAVLGHAGLATLARLTVKALQARGASGSVSVLLDDTLFTGSPLNPAWNPEDVAAGEVAPVFPIALNSARVDPATTTGPRPQDAAMTAAEAFAAQLSGAGAAAGLSVNPGVARVTPAAQGGQGAVLAEVTSATVQQQVDLMLQTSDNYLAEVMGRMSAIAAGGLGSNDGATANVVRQVSGLGITTAGLRLADVSGLALADRVSARQLTQVVQAITSGTDPRLRAALDGFPVAGLTGTLSGRYAEDSTAGGAGLVRAKTGTLNTVIALSGYVVDADGRLLVFSFIGNDLTPGAAGNTTALDRSASVLASCGCR
jgi:D-alanyl-D-alanine carboxypeptidase/D-alanyl-D-alanine-endopeptidase (penicillin-binding protein 4)